VYKRQGLDVATAITELGVGEALVSLLDEKGRPSLTERVYVLPPASQIGPITPDQRKVLLSSSIVAGVYEKEVDRESAFESLKGRTAARMPAQDETAASSPARATPRGTAAEPAPAPERGMLDGLGDLLGGGTKRTRASVGEQLFKSAASSIGREVGRQIIRGVLGSILGGKR
jgi:hypothetical protein